MSKKKQILFQVGNSGEKKLANFFFFALEDSEWMRKRKRQRKKKEDKPGVTGPKRERERERSSIRAQAKVIVRPDQESFVFYVSLRNRGA